MHVGEAMNRDYRNVTFAFRCAVVTAFACVGCSSHRVESPSPAPTVSSTTTEGRGWPFGDSTRKPYTNLELAAPTVTYGVSESEPIKVGGLAEDGPVGERMYLNALLGPNGEVIQYERIGSCCSTKSEHALFGDSILLDKYEVTWPGAPAPVILFLNMYDSGPLYIPHGFTARR